MFRWDHWWEVELTLRNEFRQLQDPFMQQLHRCAKRKPDKTVNDGGKATIKALFEDVLSFVVFGWEFAQSILLDAIAAIGLPAITLVLK